MFGEINCFNTLGKAELKEVFAKAIHEASEAAKAPFISINCGAIPEALFESELFGYERGAFSGANSKGKKGKIELAQGGTLFLDEIGEMPLDMQVKLLRVLQERKYYRVGGEKEINIDFRIIAATNRDLQEEMRKGTFREDLYYRLNVVSLQIPLLRERREDIIELTYSFLNDFSINYNRPIRDLPSSIMHELLHYNWPGNIRELRNVVERLVVFATDGIIKQEYLPFHTTETLDNHTAHSLLLSNNNTILSLQEEMDEHEKKVIERALRILNGNKLECAKQLGVTRATLYNRLKKLDFNKESVCTDQAFTGSPLSLLYIGMIFAYIICENRTRGGIHMTNKNNLIVCRCEEVTYGQLQSTIAEYNCSARELKLRTRAGMGFCGGRTCRIMIDRMIENANPDVTLNELPLKYQPPIRAVTFGSVGESK